MGTNFYLVEKLCEHCGRGGPRLHIGKRSGGWKFTWRGHTHAPPILSTYQEWRKLILSPENTVVDENEVHYTGEEFIAMVTEWNADPRNTMDHFSYMRAPENANRFASHDNYWRDSEGHAFIGTEFS